MEDRKSWRREKKRGVKQKKKKMESRESWEREEGRKELNKEKMK